MSLHDQIYHRLANAFAPSFLEILDETDKHRRHKHFQPGKYHFRIRIQASTLQGQSRLATHRAIYQALDNEMDHIHALAIELKP